jgi:hypothetical protein
MTKQHLLPNQKSAILRVTTACILAVLLLVSVFSLSMTTRTTTTNIDTYALEPRGKNVCVEKNGEVICIYIPPNKEGGSTHSDWCPPEFRSCRGWLGWGSPGGIGGPPGAVRRPDFSFECNNSEIEEVGVTEGRYILCTVSSEISTGFRAKVKLSCTPPPGSRLSCSFDQPTVTPPEDGMTTSSLYIQAGTVQAGTLLGDYKIRLTATSPRAPTKTLEVNVKVVCPGGTTQETEYNERDEHWGEGFTAYSLQEAVSKLRAGPKGYAAETNYDIQYKRTGYETGGIVKCVSVIVTITQRWPNWENKDTALKSEADKNEWNRFWSALQVHEQGHIDIIKRGYPTIEGAVGFDTAVEQLIGKTISEADAYIEKLGAATEKAGGGPTKVGAYDLEPPIGTDHGRTQGARLCPWGWNANQLQCNPPPRPPGPQPFEDDGSMETLQQDPSSPVRPTNQTTTTNETAQNAAAVSEAGEGVETVPLAEICDDGVDNDGDTLVDADDIQECPPSVTTVTPDDTTVTPAT